MNVIFLDVDGVINSVNYTRYCKDVLGYDDISGINYPFDDEALMNLKYLVDMVDGVIVISSYWRLFDKHRGVLLNKLREYDLDSRVLGYTLDLGDKKSEILDFVEKYNIDNYIILDDANIMLDFLIKTNRFNGLSLRNADDGIKLLSKKID